MNKKIVKVGNVEIGNGNISIQSMTNTKTSDIDKTVEQIISLQNAGCEIVRVSVPDEKSALAIKEIKNQIAIPLVADIHFSAKLAHLAAENGVDKIRINPGNIGSKEKVKYLVDFLKEKNIPIRIGVNAGSLESEFKHLSTAEAMVQSILKHVRILEENNFDQIVLSCKSSSVKNMITAYRDIAKKVPYPLHIGVTEAGVYTQGLIKNSIGIGSLLLDGIGDTIRVSLTDTPESEIYAAINILKAINMYNKPYCEVISCPTCARTEIKVKELAEKVDELCKNVKKNIKIAVMGCIVNGIGESEGADFGVAGGKDKSIIFKNGKQLELLSNDKILTKLEQMINEYEKQ